MSDQAKDETPTEEQHGSSLVMDPEHINHRIIMTQALAQAILGVNVGKVHGIVLAVIEDNGNVYNCVVCCDSLSPGLKGVIERLEKQRAGAMEPVLPGIFDEAQGNG